MKKNKKIFFLVSALFLLTFCLAVLHFLTRTPAEAGVLRIEYNGTVTTVPLDSIDIAPVHGTVVDGKGEEHIIDAQGVLLSDLLDSLNITAADQLTVFADDEYSATVTAQELYTPQRVYLLMTEEDRPQLIVFGDPNSKRNVSGVVRLIVS